MSRAHISRHDHTVTVDHDGADLSYLIEKAQKLWNETKPPDRPGPAFGFQVERANSHNGFAWNMGRGDQPGVSA